MALSFSRRRLYNPLTRTVPACVPVSIHHEDKIMIRKCHGTTFCTVHARPCTAMRRALAGTALLFCLGAARAGIFIEPYVQAPTTEGVTILWWTDESHQSNLVQYECPGTRRTARADEEHLESLGKYLHSTTLSGLRPGVKYKYQVQSDKHRSAAYTFTPAPGPADAVRIAILGDGRTDNDAVVAAHRAVTERAASLGPDIAFELGDMVYAGTPEHWSHYYRRVITASDPVDPGTALASLVPFHFAVGNHEIYDGHGYPGGNLDTSMALFRAFAHNPDNGAANPHWRERYYSLDFGCVTFVVLDSNNTSDDAYDNHDYLNDGDTPDWEPGSEQYKWMIRELTRAKERSAFTFVMQHPAPYCRGTHGSPGESQSGYQLRSFDPVFRFYGVDAVISSHDHVVERVLTGPAGSEGELDQGDPRFLNWLVQGNSGESARGPAGKWERWMKPGDEQQPAMRIMYFYDWAGSDERSFLDINIEKAGPKNFRATFRTVQADGDTFDEFAIERTAP